MLRKPRSTLAWPSSPGGLSSQGVSPNTGARSGATNTDQWPVAACGAGTGWVCSTAPLGDEVSGAGIRTTRWGATSGR